MKIEEALQHLETIAKGFPSSSREYLAVELGAKALLFAQQEDRKPAFILFLDSWGQDLAESQKERLAAMGIRTGVDH
jgi:hypothetical protein